MKMKILKYLQFIKENNSGKKAIIITDEGFQDQEVLQPKKALEEASVEVTIAGPNLGDIKAYNNDAEIKIEKSIKEVNSNDFDILILPGGKAPTSLRKDNSVIEFVKKFYESGKPIAAICHGPLILISADLTKDKKMTCFQNAKDELIKSGAKYEDSSCVIDGQFITSRNPDDLTDFCKEILSKI